MWLLLNSLVCPAPGPLLIERVRELGGGLRRVAGRPPTQGAGATGKDATAALLVRWSACWYLLRPALRGRQWRRVRADLREQRRWRVSPRARLTSRQAGRLQRHLRRAGGYLETIAAPPSGRAVGARLQRLQRRARKARGRRCARRRAARLAAALELLGVKTGPGGRGRLDPAVLSMSSQAFLRDVDWDRFLRAADAAWSPGGAPGGACP